MSQKTAKAQTPRDLLVELQALADEAQTMLKDSASEHSSEAITALRERFAAIQERLSENYEAAREKVIDGAKATDTAIRENPYQSVAIAAGIGLLLGMLIGRRGH